MRQYHILVKKNKVNCWILFGILRLENLECLKKVCICLCFLVCVMLRIYLHICWRTRWWMRYIQTWMRRRISYWMQLGNIFRGMLLRKVAIRRRFMPWGGNPNPNPKPNILYCHGVVEGNVDKKISTLEYNNRTVYHCFNNPFTAYFGIPDFHPPPIKFDNKPRLNKRAWYPPDLTPAAIYVEYVCRSDLRVTIAY